MAAQLAVNHVGMTVPDIDRAIAFYGAAMGFRLIFRRKLAMTAGAHEAREIFGPNFQRAEQAHLLSANGVGLELFQFIEPPVRPPADNFAYAETGIFHLCITDPDIEGLVARIVAEGGRQRSRVWQFLQGRPYKLAYCEDPFGNVIEAMSHSYAEVFGNMPGWATADASP